MAQSGSIQRIDHSYALLSSLIPTLAAAQQTQGPYYGPHMWNGGWHGWFFGPIMKYITPVFLLAIFFFWISENLFGYNLITGEAQPSAYVQDLFGENSNQVAWMSVVIILLLIGTVTLIVNSSDHFKKNSHTNIS